MSRRRRLLLRKDILEEAIRLYDEGVPGARIARNLGLTCTVTHLLRSIRMAKVSYKAMTPLWLDAQGPLTQEQPDSCKFIGFFPYGEWV